MAFGIANRRRWHLCNHLSQLRGCGRGVSAGGSGWAKRFGILLVQMMRNKSVGCQIDLWNILGTHRFTPLACGYVWVKPLKHLLGLMTSWWTLIVPWSRGFWPTPFAKTWSSEEWCFAVNMFGPEKRWCLNPCQPKGTLFAKSRRFECAPAN